MISKNKLKYIRSLGMKKFRAEEGVFVAEGPKVVGDLLRGGFELRYAVLAEKADTLLQELILKSHAETDFVTDEELRRISLMEAPQQVLAVFRQPQWKVDAHDVIQHQLCIALDEVQNPGNVGTIIRLADWFGIQHVFCSTGCADVFAPKTVQATMGALASVQVHECDLKELLSHVGDAPVYGTFLDGENIYEKHLEQRGLIVMGNEGRGISQQVASCVTDRLLIPNFPPGTPTTDSLNVAVATAVVCAEFRRQA